MSHLLRGGQPAPDFSATANTEQPGHAETAEQPETMDLETARRVEQDKITRRAALRKLGFGAGLAAFSLLGVDDFARLVGQRMERMAGDNKVATQVAKEFQQAGVALADLPPTYGEIGHTCHGQPKAYPSPSHTCSGCVNAGCANYYGSNTPAYYQCQTAADSSCD